MEREERREIDHGVVRSFGQTWMGHTRERERMVLWPIVLTWDIPTLWAGNSYLNPVIFRSNIFLIRYRVAQ